MGGIKLRIEGKELMNKTREEAFKANFIGFFPGNGMHPTSCNI